MRLLCRRTFFATFADSFAIFAVKSFFTAKDAKRYAKKTEIR
jgi:hypothetical protein